MKSFNLSGAVMLNSRFNPILVGEIFYCIAIIIPLLMHLNLTALF